MRRLPALIVALSLVAPMARGEEVAPTARGEQVAPMARGEQVPPMARGEQASPVARADDASPRLCTARFAANDPLPLERRFIGLLTGDGCTAGDLLHFTFVGESLAAAVAARHCRFDRPVLLDRGAETHLVCVWQGTMRTARP